MAKVAEYHMLDGSHITGNSLDIKYREGTFLAKTNNMPEDTEDGPEGMFMVSEANRGKITLEQIDCDPIHWKGVSRGRIKGPDKHCKSKCEYFGICPVRDYVLLLKSGFE